MRVLVVDDSADNLTLFRAILEKKDYVVTTASNGEEALELLHKASADLILSDILMPVMDGFHLLQECKSDPKLQDIPFVFVTGAFLDKKDEELALKIGVAGFVKKPVEPEALIKLIEGVISQVKPKKKGRKPKIEKEAIGRQFSINLMEKLRARMQELEEEIAERKKAEGALDQAEAEFRLLFDTMVQGVLFMDADGRIVLANPAALQILGLAADKLVGTTPRDARITAVHEDGTYFSPDELPMIIALRTGKLVKDVTMTIYNTADEKYHWIRGRAVPQFRPGEDKPYQVYATFDDITDQYLTFKALQENESRQNAILENTTDAILSIDRNYKVTAANEVAKKLYSMVAGQLEIGDNILELLPPERRAFWDKTLKQVLRSENLSFEHHYDADKDSFDIEFSVSPIVSHSGEITGVSLFGRNITERKQADQRLRESEERYRTLIENAAESIYVFQNGQVKFARSGPSPVTGYTGAEIMSKPLSEMVHPEDLPVLLDIHTRRMRGEEVPSKHTYRAIHKSGEVRWVDARVTTITWEGTPATLMFQTDITEHRRIEQAIQKTNRLYKMLYECNEAVVQATTEQQLLRNVCNVMVETGGYMMVWVGFAENDEGKTVRPMANCGFSGHYLESVDITWADDVRGRGPTGKAIRSGNTIVNQDISADPDFAPWLEEAKKEGYAASAALPLKSYWQTIGALNVYSAITNAFDLDEVNLLEQLAADLAHGITSLRERGQREQAEESLRESEHRFRKAVQSTTDIVWDWDVESGRLDWFGDIDGMLGYKQAELPRTRAAWESLLNPDDHGRVMAALDRHAQTGEPYNIEYRIQRKDGATRFWIDRGLVLRDRSGNIVHSVGACVDITEHRQTEAREKTRRNLALCLASATDLKEALQQSLEAAIKTSGADSGVIYLLEDSSGDYKSVHYQNVSAATMEMFSILHPGSEDTDLISKGVPVYVTDDRFTRRYESQFKSEGWTFTATLPVIHNGKAVACFIVCFRHMSNMPAVIRNSLEAIAADTGTAIERIRSREALKEGEEKYRNVIEVTYDAIAVSQEGNLKFFNRRAVELTGYSAYELLDMPFINLVYPEDRDMVANRYRSRMAGEQAESEYSFRYITKDGKVGWAEINTVLIEWEGKPAALSSLRDITDRKKAEDALRDSEEKYRLLVETSNEGIFVAQDGVLKFANARVSEISGYTLGELNNKPFAELIHPSDRNMVVDRHLRRLNGEVFEDIYPFRIISKKGKPIWIEVGAVLTKWDGRPATLNFISDITERKQAEDALRDSEEKYRLVVENAREGIVIVQDGKIKFANRNSPETLGYKRDEAFTRPFVEFIHPDDRQTVMDRYLRRLHGEKFADVYPFRVIAQDGSVIWVEVQVVFVDWEGRPAILCFLNNITKRKLAEEALRSSEEKYRAVVENAREGIVVLQGEYAKFINRYIPESLGYSHDFIMSHPFLDQVHPDDRQAVTERYLRRLAGEDIDEDLIIRLTNSSGAVIWVKIRAVKIEWEGNPATLNLITDITQRKQAEDALLASEEKYRNMLDSMDEGYYEIDPQGNYTFFNDALVRQLQYSREELLGLNYKAYIPPEEVKKTVEIFSDVYSTGNPRHWVPLVNIRKDGTRVYLEDSVYPLRNEKGEIIGLRGLARDVTERKAGEAALRNSEQRYRSLFQYNPVPVYMQDLHGKFLSANDATCTMTGYTREELLSMRPEQLIVPEDIENSRKHFILASKGEPETYEISITGKQGNSIYLNVTNISVVVDDEIVGVYSIARDITDRKKAETELSNALEAITSTLEGTMEAVAMMSELRDPYTAGHQKMVTQLALAIAGEMGLSAERMHGLRVAGLLHDVGKVYVPSEILSKPGKLSELERGLAKAHVTAGYDIVKAIKFPWPVEEMIHQHHERVDGSGYPKGLKGDEIMLEARILAVADTVEAMMSHRPYRPALGLDKALEEITQNRGTLYDEEVVDTCLKLFREKGFKFSE